MSDDTGVTPDWDQAACKGEPIHFWYPDLEVGQRPDYRAGQAVCAECPIRSDCAEYGADEEYGLWGGLTPDDRGFNRSRANNLRPTVRWHLAQGTTLAELRADQYSHLPDALWDRILEHL